MGGIVGLTVRFSDHLEYRGSCWTNALPNGLFNKDFYIKDRSEQHTRGWLMKVLGGRALEKDLEELWGNHHMLAPVEYGLVIVDYRTGTVVSCQGYTSVDREYTFSHDPDQADKFVELHRRKLLYDFSIDRMGRTWGSKTNNNRAAKEIAKYYSKLLQYNAMGWVKYKKQPKARMPIVQSRIKTWFDCKEFHDGDHRSWARVRAWVNKNFKLTTREKRAWAAWIRQKKRQK